MIITRIKHTDKKAKIKTFTKESASSGGFEFNDTDFHFTVETDLINEESFLVRLTIKEVEDIIDGYHRAKNRLKEKFDDYRKNR